MYIYYESSKVVFAFACLFICPYHTKMNKSLVPEWPCIIEVSYIYPPTNIHKCSHLITFFCLFQGVAVPIVAFFGILGKFFSCHIFFQLAAIIRFLIFFMNWQS
jgi:hypothetical protein